MTETPAQTVVESLRRNGVETIFGLDGDHVIYLYDALSDAPDIRVVTTMHENNAAIAAEVYGRVTGRPGVVLVTAGPGATNTLSGIAGAYAAGVPVVHISGGVAEDAALEAFHGVDDPGFLDQMFEPVTKWSTRIEDPAAIPAAIDKAFAIAASGRPGPVHVEIAVSALTSGNVNWEEASESASAADQGEETPHIPPGFLDRLDRSETIAVLAGKNALWPEVSEQLVNLAEHLNAPVAHTWDAHGAMPTVHQLSIGLWRDGIMSDVVRETFENADLVLGVGLRRGTEPDVSLSKKLGDRFVTIDAVDGPGGDGNIDAPSVPALARTLATITESSRERPADPAVAEKCVKAQRLLRDGLAVELERYRDTRPWHIGLALDSLARKMDPETLVVSDVSNVKIWTPVQIPTFNALSHIQSGSWGSMGYTIPGVLAAGLARPDRKVVGVVGDASFLMASADFGTICSLGLPVVIAVHADRTIGMIYYSLQQAFGRTYLTDVPAVDFVKYAESFGARGIRVDEPEELDAAWDEALSASGPVLLELRAGHDFPRPYPIQRIFDQASEVRTET